jgi:hypothetical protein
MGGPVVDVWTDAVWTDAVWTDAVSTHAVGGQTAAPR